MLYFVYLDEFGHIGPYVSSSHAKYNTHPVFGLGGIILPYYSIREFSTYFFKLKNTLLKPEIESKCSTHIAKWEKKGSSLFTVKNINRYPSLKKATFQLINKIESLDGKLFYVGLEKEKLENPTISSKHLYTKVLKEAIKRLDQHCVQLNNEKNDSPNYFSIIMDEQEKNVLRGEIVERASIEMFGADPKYSLVEPPIQAESHLYQTIQCADWFCGILGRLTFFQVEPDSARENEIFEKYFNERIKRIAIRSGIKKLKIA